MLLPDDSILFWKIVTNEPTTDGKLVQLLAAMFVQKSNTFSKQTIMHYPMHHFVSLVI